MGNGVVLEPDSDMQGQRQDLKYNKLRLIILKKFHLKGVFFFQQERL